MKKRIVTISLVIALLATCFAGTYAYLTDTESATNTMTMGNVSIEQTEWQRVVDAKGKWVSTGKVDQYGYTPDELEAFDNDNAVAYPAYYPEGYKWDDRNGTDNHQQSWAAVNNAPGSNQLFDDSMSNVIDKFVFVTNDGKNDVYFRTIVLIECPEGTADLLHPNFNNNSRYDYNGADAGRLDAGKSEPHNYTAQPFVVIDGVRYAVTVATHTEILKIGETARPSLLQLFLGKEATNADCALFGTEWDVLVLSQAVQSAGFPDAQTALDEAFGIVNEANLIKWFE